MSEPINVRRMVAEHLKARGYDGLYCPASDCGCQLSQLAPCDNLESMEECLPGYEHPALPNDRSGFDFYIKPEKPQESGGGG